MAIATIEQELMHLPGLTKQFTTKQFRLAQFRLRLWMILLIVNLAILVLPLGSIFFFRIYENQLVHETEVDLISQAAFISELYKRELRQAFPPDAPYGRPLQHLPARKPGAYYTPITPRLDLARTSTLGRRADGLPPAFPPNPQLLAIGARLTSIMQEAQRTTLAGMKILDADGVAIAGRQEIGLSFAHLEEIAEAMQGRYAARLRARISDEPPPPLASISRGTGIRIFVVLPVIAQDRLMGLVYLSRTPRNILKHMHAERDKVILAGGTILFLTLLLGLLTSATIARPIHELIGKTKRISAGDATAIGPLKNPGTSEMQALAKSFSDMATSLHQRSEYVREFAAHVSHEFKTPLTSIHGAAELLSEHLDEMHRSERDKFLQNIVADADRMKRLVSRLLQLAEADNMTPGEQHISAFDALQTIKHRHEAPEFQIDVQADVQTLLRISNDNFTAVIGNLLENARQHGASKVAIETIENGSSVEVLVADNGAGISKANRAHIFTPFFTTRRKQGGTGLGLRIVKSLLEAHRGSIRLSETASGAQFVITLQRV